MSHAPDALAALSPEKLALLKLMLEEEGDRFNTFPLSFAQQRLWFLDRLDPGRPVYNVPEALALSGRLDVDALRRALDEIVRRHETLRTTFRDVDGDPVQAISPPESVPLAVEDLSHLPPIEREAEARRRARYEALRPFDLAAGPLLRARLLRLADDEHVLLLTTHHIVSDGWSMGVFFRELGALYGAFSRGEPSPLPELEIQYADFAAWQREHLDDAALAAQVEWWRQALAGAPAALELPADRPRPAVQTHAGALRPFRIPAAVAEAARALALREGTTPFVVHLAAFQLLLARYTGQDDVVVGSPFAGRTRPETEPLIGFFINTLPLRTRLSGDPSFRALVGRARETVLGAHQHQDVPFEALVDALQPERSLERQPFFQVSFSLERAPAAGGPGLPGLAVRPLPVDNGTAKLDLQLVVVEGPPPQSGAGGGGSGDDRGAGDLDAALQYNTDLFDASTAARMAGHFAALLEAALASPDAPVSALPLLTAEEAREMEAWNRTGRPWPSGCVHEWFAEQAARTPHAPAVVTDQSTITYGELDARANRLAHHLRRLGIGPEARVGICLERGPALVEAILGVLKSGGAYVPLDPAHPAARRRAMLEDAGVVALVTHARFQGEMEIAGVRTVALDADAARIAAERADAPESGVEARNLAYVVYTSGSTGAPKGAMVPHAAIAARTAGMQALFGLGAGDRQLQFVSPGFDVLAEELFPPLASGAAVAPLPGHGPAAPADVLAAIRRLGVTKANLPASYWHQVVDEMAAAGLRVPPSLRLFVTGAEAPAYEKLVKWVELADHPVRSLNVYGPTEATVLASWYEMRVPGPGGAARIPIGRPLENTGLHVLDAGGRQVPIGVPGELYIGGAGVGRGYLGQPGLTAERFVPDPFSPEPGVRLYRTGDRVRRLAGGELEFLGRVDEQVKIRGFRIEPGEIEAVLARHPGVRQAVVVARSDAGGEKRLAAYVVPEGEATAPAALRAYLRERLPEHMVPSAFVSIDTIPLTSNTKVDRARLPEPDWGAPDAGTEFVAPRTPEEAAVAEAWREVLGVERVGVHDDFFALGGNSLKLVRVHARLARAHGEVSVVELFRHATVEGMARALAGGGAAPSPTLDAADARASARLAAARRRVPTRPGVQGGTATEDQG